jgi:RNA polymerase sigma-70 factor (ECF subfamily)
MQLPDPYHDFLAVIETHKGILYKVARSYAKNTDDHQDLIQEIILQLWRSFEKYDDQYQHSTWIYRIALNVAISFYRKEKRRGRWMHHYQETLFHWQATSTPAENAGNIRLLEKCIAELKDMDKALMLLYLEEKSHRDIAVIMGISETNVSTKIDRIKKILKQKLSPLLN